MEKTCETSVYRIQGECGHLLLWKQGSPPSTHKTRVCVEKPERENAEANHTGGGKREALEDDLLIALKSNHCIS